MTRNTKLCLITSIGLSCLFAGIWLGDAQIVPLLALPFDDLVMRCVSLIIYSLFFLLVYRKTKHGKKATEGFSAEKQRVFLMKAGVLGLICYLVTIAFVLYLAVSNQTAASFPPLLPWIFIVLAKLVGAPASIALVCVFSSLYRADVIRCAAVGYCGAFILQALVTWSLESGFLTVPAVLILSAILIVIAYACSITKVSLPVADSDTLHPHLVTRPFKQIMSKGFVIGVVIASMMLGFFRSNPDVGDPHLSPIVALTLAVLVLLIFLSVEIGTQELFRAALICVAASILLAALFNVVLPDAGSMLGGIGSALFEIVVWSLAVWAARNCSEPLLAATGTRLATVIGHLLGTIIISIAFLTLGQNQQAIQAAALVIVFIYIVLLLFLFRNPDLQLPFFAPYLPDQEASKKNHKQVGFGKGSHENSVSQSTVGGNESAKGASNTEDTSNTEGASNTEDTSRLQTLKDEPLDSYWSTPCAYLSEVYGLTSRETEVLEQLARGRDLGSMEEKFVISRNTLKMHIRNIYAKLDIHSKQDVIDLVEEARAVGSSHPQGEPIH